MGVRITWTDPNSVEDGYAIYRHTASLAGLTTAGQLLPYKITELPADATSYDDSGALDGQTYYYVAATVQSGEVYPAAEVSVVTPGEGSDPEPVYDPTTYFDGTKDGAWYDVNDLSTLAQQTDGTGVVAVGDPVRYVADKSGNGYHWTSSNPALLAQDEYGKHHLDFAGASWYDVTVLEALMANQSFEAWLELSMDVAQKTTSQFVMDFRPNNTSGRINVIAGFVDSAVEANCYGSRVALSGQPYAARNLYRSTFSWDATTGQASMQVNGVKQASGSGTTANNPSGAPFFFGCNAMPEGDLPFFGRFYGGIFLPPSEYSAADETSLLQWMRGRLPSFHLYLVAGQSNSVGTGDSAQSPAITAGLGYEYTGSAAIHLFDPVGAASDGSAWPAFADGYVGSTGAIPVIAAGAESGSAQSPLSELSADKNWTTTGWPYQNAITLANNMEGWAQEWGLNYAWGGVLWCQGERDAQGIEDSLMTQADYISAFETMVPAMRSDIGTDVAIWIARTGTRDSGDTQGFADIRAAQDGFPASLSGVTMAFTGAVDFPAEGKMSDELHYTQVGYNEMGAAMRAAVVAATT